MNSEREESETAKSSLDAIIALYKRDVDRALIRENLRLTVEERFVKLMRLQRFAEELRRAGSRSASQTKQQGHDYSDKRSDDEAERVAAIQMISAMFLARLA